MSKENGFWKLVASILLTLVLAGGAGKLWGEAQAEARVDAVEEDVRAIKKAIQNLYLLLLEEKYGEFRDQ